MPKLILVKHAKPLVQPEVPSHEWPLSDEGRRQCQTLADRLRRQHPPQVVVASTEPKAAETGRLLADALGVPFDTAPDLHEHDRGNVPHMPTREFISYMALFFKRPTERVLGRETAEEARSRFGQAVRSVLESYDGRDVIIVTHGTVLALYAAEVAKTDPYLLWRQMGLPSFVVFELLPEARVVERVDTIG